MRRTTPPISCKTARRDSETHSTEFTCLHRPRTGTLRSDGPWVAVFMSGALWVGGVSSARAADDHVEEEETSEELVVTGTRTATPLGDAPVATEVITREEIESSGALDVASLLEEHPGIDLYRSYLGAAVRMQVYFRLCRDRGPSFGARWRFGAAEKTRSGRLSSAPETEEGPRKRGRAQTSSRLGTF